MTMALGESLPSLPSHVTCLLETSRPGPLGGHTRVGRATRLLIARHGAKSNAMDVSKL